VVQAKAQASWLSDLLHKSTGKAFHVKPILVFPGWWVESKNMKEIWVLNPKGIDTFLSNEGDTLTKEDAALISYHLSRHIRTSFQ